MIRKRVRGDTGVQTKATESLESTKKIEELMQEGDWTYLRSVLRENYQTKHIGSILALALKMGAPEDIVKTIIGACPESVREEDELGRLPIHLSCLVGASSDIVRRLLETDPTSAMRKDQEGRLALHHAVQYCILSKGVTLDTVEVLCSFAPRAAHERDLRDESPLDLSVEMESSAVINDDVETEFAAREVSWTIQECASSW